MGEERAQISLEFVLIVGAFLVIAITVFPVITKQNELNKALAAARDGATFGAGMRGIGFTSGNPTPEAVIKIDRLELLFQNKTGDLDEYQIKIYIIAPEYIKNNSAYRASVAGTIRNQALSSIYYTFNGEWPPGGIVSRVNTTHYSFTAGNTFT